MEVLGEKLEGFSPATTTAVTSTTSFSTSGGETEEKNSPDLRVLWGKAWHRTAAQVGLNGSDFLLEKGLSRESGNKFGCFEGEIPFFFAQAPVLR